jgi:hypothetical protein
MENNLLKFIDERINKLRIQTKFEKQFKNN